jgi:hypothetical protein
MKRLDRLQVLPAVGPDGTAVPLLFLLRRGGGAPSFCHVGNLRPTNPPARRHRKPESITPI